MIRKNFNGIKRIKNISIYTFILSISLFFISSCQSGKESLITKDQLSKQVLSCFDSCKNISGASNVQVYVKDKLKTSFDIEWSKIPEEFKIVMYNSLGQDLSYFHYSYSNKTISTNINEFIPYKISLEDNGYLSIDGYTIPLKLDELPCILGYKYPISWLKDNGISKIKNRYMWDTDWDIRSINTDISLKKNKYSNKNKNKNKTKNKNLYKEDGINSNRIHSCSVISWRSFLFFHSNIKICYEDNKYMVLDFKDYILKFTNID